jgi:hypothetical protein
VSTPSIPGFTRMNSQPKPRLILSIEGLDKSGKSNLAFTAPGPLGYLEFDIGAEGVVEKFQDDKVILAPKAYETRFEGGAQKTDADKEFGALREGLQVLPQASCAPPSSTPRARRGNCCAWRASAS